MSRTSPSRRRTPLRLAVALALCALGTVLAVPATADTIPPTTTATLAGERGGGGWFTGPAEVRLTAEDVDGVARTEHRVDGGPWQDGTPGEAVVTVTGAGAHLVEFRSTDGAGNVEAVRSVRLRIDDRAPTATATARPGGVDVAVDDTLVGSGALAVEHRVAGGEWVTTRLDEVLFDGTQASLDRWRMVGPGSFALAEDGAMRTSGGLGMLWYPDRELGDVAITMQWRDAREDGQRSNGGVFIRFPDPEAATALAPVPQHPCQLGLGLLYAEWAAIGCGHEIQVNDADVDPQKTGSVYNFAPVDTAGSNPVPFGEWTDYEIRTVGAGDYVVEIVRDGAVLNRWQNSPGQRPARFYDPPTDLRQFASGYLGLQNHGSADTIDYRDIRILDLAPRTVAIPVAGVGPVEVRVVDAAGNATPVQQVSLLG
jgi:hypothetical protein